MGTILERQIRSRKLGGADGGRDEPVTTESKRYGPGQAFRIHTVFLCVVPAHCTPD